MLPMTTRSSQKFEDVGGEFKVNFDMFTRRQLSTDRVTCEAGNLSKRDARICSYRRNPPKGFMGFLIRVADFGPIIQFAALAFIFIVGWCASPFQSWPSPVMDMYCAEARDASEGVPEPLPEFCLNAVDLLGRKNGAELFNYGGCEIAVSTILSLGSLLYGVSNMLYSGAPTTLGLKTPGAVMQIITFVMLFLGVYAMQDAHDEDTVVSAVDTRVLEAARGATLMWTAFILSCVNVGLTILDMSV